MLSAALVVAAGRGERFGGTQPKQYARLGERPVLYHSVQALLASPRIDLVLVVIHPDDHDLYRDALGGISDPRLLRPASGGADRSQSVAKGLHALAPNNPDQVLIHDAARPLLPLSVIDRVLDALKDAPGAVPGLPVVDALWRAKDGEIGTSVERDDLWRAQTPQGFHFDAIRAAHDAHEGEATDDVAVARAAGLTILQVPGSEDNFKITTAPDLARATQLLERSMDIRTGNGFDVHAFEPGDHVILCGVRVPHDCALKGHSDADVAMHAITDAIYGALAEGDIGHWFPPSDPQWKGAASDIFLRHACNRGTERGFRIMHLDCTIICEKPKIGPHCAAMRETLAGICGIDKDRISVKATTSERLGFTGREEGIAALASATLVAS